MTTPTPRWIRRLGSYLRRYPALLIGTVVGSGALALNAAIPVLIKAVIDDIAAGNDAATRWALIGMGVVALALFATSFLRRYSAGKLSLNVQHDLRRDVFNALQRLDGPGQDALRTGQIVSRASSDLQMVQGLLAFAPMSLGQVAYAAISLVLMLILSPLLTAIALLFLPATVYLVRQFRNQIMPSTWVAQQAAADVAELVEENVTGIRIVKSFGQEHREVNRLRQRAGRLFAFRLRLARISARTILLPAMTSLGQVLVLVIGGYLAIHGTIGLGTFVAFNIYLAALAWPMRGITMLLVMGQQAGAAFGRVIDIVDTQAQLVDPEHGQILQPGPLAVEFSNVHFSYGSDDAVLQGFSLTVRPGDTVAVVGPSGSGKSTLTLLLPRFYDPSAGTIRLGGHDLRDLLRTDLRQTVGCVFEEPFLFSASIADNIAYGRPDAPRAAIIAAAQAAEADEFIRALPDGYDAVIGERGLTLSGGQRQRVALARSLLTDPAVLVLDDATSAVDPATEAAIHATLQRVTQQRTTILIAHRRSTLELADTIAVVDGGRVIDHGTHQQLTDRCPLYRRLLGAELSRPIATATEQDGTTAQLWPKTAPAQRVHQLQPTSGNRRAGGGNGLMSAMASVPVTPELLARVSALPPATDQPHAKSATQGRFSLRSSLRPVRSLLLTALVLVGFDAAASAAIPVILRGGIDNGVTTGRIIVVGWLALGASVLVVIDYFVQRAQQVVMARAGESVLFGLREREFTHLQQMGLSYYEREKAGRIMTRMTTDVDALSTFLQTGLVTVVVSITTFTAVVTALLVLDAPLAMVALSAIPLVAIATWFFRSYSTKQYAAAREQVAEVNADFQENVAGLRATQAFGRSGRNAETFAVKSDTYRQVRVRAQTAVSLYFPFIALLTDVALIATLAVGSRQVAAGSLTSGTLLAFVLYLNNLYQPVQQLSQVFDGYQQAKISLRRIGELLDTPIDTPISPAAQHVSHLSGDIRLTGVDFKYTADGPLALQDVNLHILPGETVAIVGPTGAGKSTLIKLIARFYDVTAGAVLIDGTDVRNLDLPSFRRCLGTVPQEAHLFVGTVASNVAYGRPDADQPEIEGAARSVGALTAIAGLSNGFHHDVDERGRNLAAGQRQLISLARAELVKPQVLLLDEATAALDAASEAAVLAATAALTRDRTTIVVAHRLTTAARADRIVVMVSGRIAEIGTHHELLSRGGVYTQLYASARC